MCFGAGALWSSGARAAWRSPFFKNVHTLGVDVRRSLGATHSRMLVVMNFFYTFLFVFFNIVYCSCLIWGSGPLPYITTCTQSKHLRGVGCSSSMCFGAGALWSSGARAAWRSPFFKNVHTLGVDVRRSLGATHSRMLVVVNFFYAFYSIS